jgi:CHAT domain-containing protein
MSNEPKAGKGIDPETLAAYIDQRLSPEQRAVVEAQLATDPDSYEVLVETLKALDDDQIRTLEVKEPPRPQDAAADVAPFRPKPQRSTLIGWKVAAGVLATAAAIAIVVMQPEWLQRLRGDGVDPRLEGLVAAVGEERYIEARLTGGFKYGPLRSPTRGNDLSGQNLGLLAAAGELQKQAKADPSAENLHAWGVAQLLLGDFDGSISTLSGVLAATPSAPVLNDLSAAHSARAQTQSRGEDWAAALAFAERAISADPTMLEALYARAVAIEGLRLRDQAIRAWETYLQLDSSTGWAAEARRRLTALQSASAIEDWPKFRGDLLAGVDGRLDEQQFNRFSQNIRELLEDELLPAWGSRFLSLRQGSAERALARKLADRLLQTGGDGLAASVVDDIEGDDGTRRERLAKGLVAFGQGRALFEAESFAQAESLLRQAATDLSAVSSQLAIAAHLGLAQIGFFRGEVASLSTISRSLLQQLESIPTATAHRGKVRWAVGLASGVQGQLADAVQHYQSALGDFQIAHERENEGYLHSLLAEAYGFLGDPVAAWDERVKAFDMLGDFRAVRRRQSVLIGGALLAERQGMPEVAASITDASVVAAQQSGRPALQIEALARRARLRAITGDTDLAKTDVADARRHLAALEQAPLTERLEGELLEAELEVASRDETAASNESIALFQSRQMLARTPKLWMSLGRAKSRRHDWVGAADAFDNGLRALSPGSIAGQPWRMAFADEAAALTTGLAESLLELHRNESAVLAVLSARRSPVADWSKRLETIPVLAHGAAVLVVAPTDDRLLTWLIAEGSVSGYSATLARPALEKLIADCRTHVLTIGDPSGCEALYESIIAPHRSKLNGIQRLKLSMPPSMFDLPVAALSNRQANRYLIEEHDLSILASSDYFARPEPRVLAKRRLLAVANPASKTSENLPLLPASEGEARRVADLYPTSRVLLGGEAQKNDFLTALGTADVLHFAGHSVWNATYPGLSRLVLAGKGAESSLFAFELMAMGKGVRAPQVVVLASCSSGRSSVRGALGPIGLPTGFLALGARAVIATARAIPDDAETSHALFRLHQRIVAGVDPVRALADTQRESLDTHQLLAFQVYQ